MGLPVPVVPPPKAQVVTTSVPAVTKASRPVGIPMAVGLSVVALRPVMATSPTVTVV
jgi:hypothetical protein